MRDPDDPWKHARHAWLRALRIQIGIVDVVLLYLPITGLADSIWIGIDWLVYDGIQFRRNARRRRLRNTEFLGDRY